jgi:hypothetical protein
MHKFMGLPLLSGHKQCWSLNAKKIGILQSGIGIFEYIVYLPIDGKHIELVYKYLLK